MAKPFKKDDIGKGIRALLNNIENESKKDPEKVVRELSGSVAEIPVSAIEVNPFQPRKDFDPEALKDLSESLKIHGLIQPITVRRMSEGQYQLISGERRLRASKIAGLTMIPAYVRIANDQELLEMALVENIQRENLNPIEIAITYQRLVDECQLTHETLSGRVGKNRSTVTNFLRLLKLPPDIQSSVKEKKLSMGHARALVGIDDVGFQLSVFRETITKDLSVRELEALIRIQSETKANKKASSKSQLPESYRLVQDTFSSFFGTKVQLKRNSLGKGQVMINFQNDHDLNRLLDIIEEKEKN
jgi:ParB family transcriptional regulator, chromosome partitioning protein